MRSLAGCAIIAVVFGLLESMFGVTWNIAVIVIVETRDRTNDTNGTIYFHSTLESPGNNSVFYENPWTTLKETLTSERTLGEHILEVISAALVANLFWLIATLGLAVGNAENCSHMLKPWIAMTAIMTAADIAATAYFIYKAVNDVQDVDMRNAFFDNYYVFAAFMFSRGGPVIWILNIVLCVYVAKRSKEIRTSKTKRMLIDSEFSIAPYTLNPPYYAFEGSTQTTESLRPGTPPPDYEGRKRPPLEYGVHHHRPLSFYDDSVHLQHRDSCAAETVLHHHHAYENRGLVMEEWMGIPRPTLKSRKDDRCEHF